MDGADGLERDDHALDRGVVAGGEAQTGPNFNLANHVRNLRVHVHVHVCMASLDWVWFFFCVLAAVGIPSCFFKKKQSCKGNQPTSTRDVPCVARCAKVRAATIAC